MTQTASQLLMIRPVNFYFNPQTAVNNFFQKDVLKDMHQKALEEFNRLVKLLKTNKIEVFVVDDTLEPATPDSVFPNNWISFHEDDSITLYPMFAPNRRLERKQYVLDTLNKKFNITETHNLSHYELQNRFLEGTGSLVLDRINKIAYASVSQRTDPDVVKEFCKIHEFSPIIFHSRDVDGTDIYHTNVMMCIADQYAIICLESVHDENEKEMLINALSETNKQIVDISLYQLQHFAGNMLQVKNKDGELLLVMSTQAFKSLTTAQIKTFEKYNHIIHTHVETIETCGGGSVRCMIAEVFNHLK